MSQNPRRFALRSILASLAGLFTSRHLQADTLLLTPKATEGPFYPKPSMRLEDIDNDLVRIDGAVRQAGGEIVRVKGRVLDKQGKPLPGLRIEIWQCDVNGKYLHPGDSGGVDHDPGFQGFGHDITNANGEYQFRTIRPTQYPGRTPHIHVKILNEEKDLLTTQFYIRDEPENARDGIFRRLSKEQADSVSMHFVKAQGQEFPEAVVDVVC